MRLRNVALSIIGINIAMFVLQTMIGPTFTSSMLLETSEVLLRPWMLITSMFVHANPTHLLFNMYSLFIFGPLIEQRVGSKRFLIVYLLTGILASLATLPFHDRVLGASGAIMGIIGMTIMLLPHLRLLLFFVIPMSLRTAGILFAFIDIVGLFSDNGVANIAHLAGLGIGLLAGYLIKRRFTGPTILAPKRASKKRLRRKQATTIEVDENSFNEYLRSGRI